MALIAFGLGLNAVDSGSNAGLTSPLGYDVIFPLWAAAYATVGALIGVRRPENPIGWIMLGAGFVLAASSALFEYANRVLSPGASLPGGVVAAWLAFTVSPFALALVALALLLFPDGRLRSRRWRAAAWLPVGACAALAVGIGLYPGPLDEHVVAATNPIGISSAAGAIDAVQALGWALLVMSFAAAGAAIVVNLRRSVGLVRQQIKWVAGAGVVLGLTWAWWTLTYVLALPQGVRALSLALMTLAVCGIPIAAGIAILRYRLYEIDVLIRRTLTYGALVALLASVYVGCVVALEAVFQTISGQSGPIAETLSTLAVAALFRPALRRVRRAVDRRFARSAYDAARTLAAFSGRLRHQIDLETLESEVLGVVRETLQPTHASLWLRPPPADTSSG